MSYLHTRALIAVAILLISTVAVRVSNGEVVDKIVAVINDGIITLSELNAAVAIDPEKIKDAASGEPGKTPGETVKSATLDRIIEQKLVKQASDKAGIDVSEREIDNSVEEILNQNRIGKEQLIAELLKNGLTFAEYREQLKEQIRQVKFIEMKFRSRVSIPAEDIEDYYRQNLKEFYGPASFRVRLIQLLDNDKELQSMRLKAVQRGIEEGEDFAELASQYSDDASSTNGGDLGYLEYGEIDARLEKAASMLKSGGISAPIAGPGGLYLIKLEDRRAPEPKPLEEMAGLIHQKLFDSTMEEIYNSWLKETKRSAHIEVRL